jgi:hypothetical protein
VVVAAVAYIATRPGEPEPPAAPAPVVAGTSTVMFDILPWARIESIVRADGKEAATGLTTPCLVSLEPGQYRVRARNPFFPDALEFDLQVVERYQEVRRTLPAYEPGDEARRMLEGR